MLGNIDHPRHIQALGVEVALKKIITNRGSCSLALRSSALRLGENLGLGAQLPHLTLRNTHAFDAQFISDETIPKLRSSR